MAIIWLVEDPNHADTVSIDLCANFPVRIVASLESLSKLLTIEKQMRPNVILYRDQNSSTHRNTVSLIRCHTNVPVVILSDRNESYLAADEQYMTFPLILGLPSLFSTIRKLLPNDTNQDKKDDNFHVYKHLRLDKTSGHVLTDCGRLDSSLAAKEAGILSVLIERSGECVPRDFLVERLWKNVKVGPRTLDSHVSRLRKRLENVGIQIENIYGSGYLLR